MKAKIYNFFAFLGSLAVVYCLFSIFFSFEVIEAKKAALVALGGLFANMELHVSKTTLVASKGHF